MTDVLSNIPAWTGPIILVIFNVLLPQYSAFKRLKGRYNRGDRTLRFAIFAKYSFPHLALIIAFGGLFTSMGMSGSIWGWFVGFGGLLIAGGFFMLQHLGPFYPLINDLDDLEDKVKKFSETNPTQQGT
jgi:hypothetical protein